MSVEFKRFNHCSVEYVTYLLYPFLLSLFSREAQLKKLQDRVKKYESAGEALLREMVRTSLRYMQHAISGRTLALLEQSPMLQSTDTV